MRHILGEYPSYPARKMAVFFVCIQKANTARSASPSSSSEKKPPLSIPRELPLPNPCIFWLDVSYIHEQRCVNMLCNAKDFVSNCVAWQILGSFPTKKKPVLLFCPPVPFLSHRIYPPPLERPRSVLLPSLPLSRVCFSTLRKFPPA